MMTGLECGHRFCTSCWCEYLTTKIMEEGLGQSIACAAHGCDILVDDVTVMRLITEPRVKLKYQHLITNSFVEVCISLSVRLSSIYNFHMMRTIFNFFLKIFDTVQSVTTLVSVSRLYLCGESPVCRSEGGEM